MTTVLRIIGRSLRSVRGRITLISTALVAVTLTVASLFLIRLVEADLLQDARTALDQALAEQAASIANEAELLPSDFPIDDQRIGVVGVEIDGLAVELGIFEIDEDGLAIGVLFLEDEPFAELVLDPETDEIIAVADPFTGQPLDDPDLVAELQSLVFEVRELALDEDELASDGLLVTASPLSDIEGSIAALRAALLRIVPLLIAGFGLLIWWLVGLALRPVHSITARVEAISTSSLDQRVPVPDTGDEIAEMASVMNQMLGRLERGGQRQRQFSADASHELRSPLATVRAAAEVLQLHPTRERAVAMADDIVAETDRMEHLITDLLELARLDESKGSIAMEPVDLGAIVRHELDEDSVELTIGAPVPVIGAPRQLGRIVRNLVDNARRYANDRVVVTVETVAGVARVAVDDDGDGVPDGSEHTIFERFSRLDEARDRDSGGSGLGLALVRAIAEHHGGSATVGRSPIGGARFTIEIPADPAGLETAGLETAGLETAGLETAGLEATNDSPSRR